MLRKLFSLSLVVSSGLLLLALTQATPSQASALDQTSKPQLNNAPPSNPPENQEMNGRIKAMQQVKSMIAKQRARSPRAAGIDATSWKWIGPSNVGGRVKAIAMPDSKTIYVGGASGGVWKSTDSGATWKSLDDFMASLNVSSIVVDPNNPNLLYVGTGETMAARPGAGIFKSTNGGDTWTQLPIPPPNSNFQYVNRLAISSNNILLAATNTGIWRSTDGGATWSNTNTTASAWDVAFDPRNNLNAVAANSTALIYSRDGGSTWSTSSTSPAVSSVGRALVSFAASSPTMTSAGVAPTTSVVYALGGDGSLYRSADGGVSYAKRAIPGYNSSYSIHMALWVDPKDAAGNTFIAAGISEYRSSDGGSSYQRLVGNIYIDKHVIVSDPNYDGVNNKTVYEGNDGGLYRTTDIKSTYPLFGGVWITWDKLDGLGITQFYGGAGVAAGDTFTIIGGTQDRGSQLVIGSLSKPSDSLNKWKQFCGGDGGFAAIDPTNTKVFYGQTIQFGAKLTRTTDGGASGEESCQPIESSAMSGEAAVLGVYFPFLLDPNNPATMLVGKYSLWRSTNVNAATPAWTGIKSAPGSISTIAVAPGNSDIIWIGSTDGRIFKTTNGTSASPTWTEIDPGPTKVLPSRQVWRITLQPSNSDIVYAAFDEFQPNNLWKSTNGGATWTNVGTGLPQVPVRALAISPCNPAWLYAGTAMGIFASEDGGTSWKVYANTFGDTFANAIVSDLFWMGNTLVAATYGRGMYIATPGCSALSITSLSPVSRKAGDPGFTLTVNGMGFQNGAKVQWDGLDLTTNFGSATQLTADVSPDLIANAATRKINVKNPDGTVTTCAASLDVTESGAAVTASAFGCGANPTVSTQPTSHPNAPRALPSITASAQGVGELILEQFSADPEMTPAVRPTGVYFEVDAIPANEADSFDAIMLTFCNLNGGNNIQWLFPALPPEQRAHPARLHARRSPKQEFQDLWVDTSPQSYNPATGCITLNLDNDSSLPFIDDLVDGAEFAATLSTKIFFPFVGK